MNDSKKVKIQTFVPKTHADKVRLAIGKTGAAKIGNYNHCTFVTEGKGYFLPMDGAHPTIGEVGKIEQVEEVKIEFICDKDKINDAINAIKNSHPYEEIPIDIFPLVEL